MLGPRQSSPGVPTKTSPQSQHRRPSRGDQACSRSAHFDRLSRAGAARLHLRPATCFRSPGKARRIPHRFPTSSRSRPPIGRLSRSVPSPLGLSSSRRGRVCVRYAHPSDDTNSVPSSVRGVAGPEDDSPSCAWTDPRSANSVPVGISRSAMNSNRIDDWARRAETLARRSPQTAHTRTVRIGLPVRGERPPNFT